MPNARGKGQKLAGAYIPDEKDAKLIQIAKRLAFKDKAAYLRHLYDLALEAAEGGEQLTQTPTRRSAAEGS